MKTQYKVLLPVLIIGLILLPAAIGVSNKNTIKMPVDAGLASHQMDASTERTYSQTGSSGYVAGASAQQQSGAVNGAIVNGTYSFKSFECWINNPYVNSCWQSVANYTFSLPQASYVYVESSGFITDYEGFAGVALAIDNSNPCYYDMNTYRLYQGTTFTDPANGYTITASTGYQTGRIYYLAAGTHTVYLDGLALRKKDSYAVPTISGISITVIASQKGNLAVVKI